MFDKLKLYYTLWRMYRRRQEMFGIFKSKKFWAMVVGAVVVTAGTQLGLSQDQAVALAAVITGYIVGQGIADSGKERAKIEAGKR